MRSTTVLHALLRVTPQPSHFIGDLRLSLFLVELPERLVAEDAGQVVVEISFFFRHIAVRRQRRPYGDKRFLYHVIGIK